MARKTIVGLEAELKIREREIYDLEQEVYELHRTVDMLKTLGATAANNVLLEAISSTAKMIAEAAKQ